MHLLIQGEFQCPRFPFVNHCWPSGYLNIYDPVVEVGTEQNRPVESYTKIVHRLQFPNK